MSVDEPVARHAQAAAELDQYRKAHDGVRLVQSLSDGLDQLRNLLFQRVHQDVERSFGTDSMLMPLSESKSEAAAKTEIDLYQIVVSVEEVQRRGYLRTADSWYLQWLSRLRFGDPLAQPRLAGAVQRYLSLNAEDRRLAFTDALVNRLPEAGRAPLVLYRLFPLAVRIGTNVAFRDRTGAEELRQRQQSLLPSIHDCAACHGRILENEQSCPVCGNPLWKYEWLTSSF